jgi:endonuclease YncB( thermonuclease family)
MSEERGFLGKPIAAVIAAALAITLMVAGADLVQAQAQSTVITGRARVIDGDTLRIGDHRIRLWGIGTPADGAKCHSRRLDRRSQEALRNIVRRRVVECHVRETDSDGRQHAVCTVRGRDVAQAMVERGWARDWPRYSCGAYSGAEARARQDRIGAWHYECPGIWGQRNYSAERCPHLGGER